MNPFTIAVVVTLAVLILLLVVAAVTRMRGGSSSGDMHPDVKAMVGDARVDPGEQVASLAAEQIESVVQAKLGDYLAQSGATLDFGNLPDGGLAINLNGTQYTSVDAVPDATIRDAIKAAVAEFNR